MLLKLTGTEGLSKTDIKTINNYGFETKYILTNEAKKEYGGAVYEIIQHYELFIMIDSIMDLTVISNILHHDVIIAKEPDSDNYYIEVYNGYRE